ncbi:LacI family DNA-binding transcriptional regulator [Roseateles asaccharophilus]|uniref:DNA-binding LacI/PurR family transcriptional regulator n=1 Tax=Roseateles asaccharophilus TaxID=582607 RepID=A0ABU2A4C9_9BURK|nr:LacI family DNA-binding transcriptional regulator [Roseateles asaccharophilus]MDR7332059.1 DNA-binding LacI/PurR family transcriptional regulator [Roseateles asaccharophilus]
MADKRGVTIRELAQAAGVSIGTVSRALKGQPGLSEQTRAQVMEVAQQLGYDTAKLRTGKPRRMLFLYSRHMGSLASNPFYSYVLHGAETACREAGVPLSLMSVVAGDDVAAQVRRHEADALLGAGYMDPEVMDAVRQCDLPLVLVDHFHPGIRSINDDNLLGGWLATKHLLEGSAQRVAAIFGPLAHYSTSLRAKGFRRALFEAGRLFDPDYEVTLDPALDYREAGRDAMRRLLALPEPPDAVFAYNDSTAMHAIEYCHEQGLRVPDDVRFIGYDDIEAAARFKPPLSTVKMDKEALGQLAARALIEGDTEPNDAWLPVELVVRESSAPAAPPPTPARRPRKQTA